jgi:hypothetical protein
LNTWITPLASVAMLEKLALLKIALCSAPVLTSDSSVWWCAGLRAGLERPVSSLELEIGCP